MTVAPSISFGTAGWRGIVGKDFTFATVRQFAYALVRWWETQEWPKKVALCYDSRFLSERFADECAAVFARYNFDVLLTHRDTPQPAFSWYVRKNQIPAGLNFTGSHNPPQFGGVKLVDVRGAVWSDQLAGQVEKAYQEHREHRILAFTFNESLIRYFDPRDEYLDSLLDLIDTSVFSPGLRIVVDPLYGTAREYLDGFLARIPGLELELLHSFKDPYFSGYAPEATGQTVKDLLKLVRSGKYNLGIATDGDGDRFGIVDQGGYFMPPERVLSILYHYLLAERRLSGGIVRNVATSHMLDHIAQDFQQTVYETPIGFKNMAPYLWKEDVLVAVEESSGFAMNPHIPDKDGILAGLLACEVIARTGQSLQSYWKRLVKQYGPFYQAKSMCPCEQKALFAFERLLEAPPDRIAHLTPERIEFNDGIKFYFSNETWLLVRRAGTEPVIRIYSESHDPDKAKALVREVLHQLQKGESE